MAHGLTSTGISFSNGNTMTASPDFVSDAGGTNCIKLISSSNYSSATIQLPDGRLVSWGGNQNSNREAGTGISPESAGSRPLYILPMPHDESGTIVYAKSTGSILYVRYSTGNLYSCGYGAYGSNANNGSFTSTYVLTLVATNVAFVAVPEMVGYSVGYEHVMIVKTDGTLWAAGYNAYGQLGLGDNTNRAAFTQVTSVAANTIAQTAEQGYAIWVMGSYTYGMTVIQKTDGTIWFCGRNNVEYNVTGVPQYSYDYYGNTRYAYYDSMPSFTDITAYWGGAGGGAVWNCVGCGGYYDSGPSPEKTGQNLIMVRTTNQASNATIYCGGINTSGQCKNGTFANTFAVNSFVLGTGAVGQLRAMGGVMSVYYLRNGVLYSWGYGGYGQLGSGAAASSANTVTNATSPSGNAWAEIMTKSFDANTYGYTGTMFVKDVAGNVYACGYNGHGQCANGGTAATNSFTLCPELKNALQIVGNGFGTGNWFMAVLPSSTYNKTNGRLVMWGHGNWLQIDNTLANVAYTRPVEVKTQYRI